MTSGRAEGGGGGKECQMVMRCSYSPECHIPHGIVMSPVADQRGECEETPEPN